jgi:uncharacterized protein
MRRFINGIFSFSTRHAGIVIAVTMAFSVVFAFFAFRVRVNADLGAILPTNSPSNAVIEAYGGNKPSPDTLVVAFKGDNLFTLETLGSFSRTIDGISALPGIVSAITPFNLPSFGKAEDGRLDIATLSPAGTAPKTEADIAVFRSRLMAAPYARKLAVSPSGNMLVAFFQVERVGDYSPLMKKVYAITGAVGITGVTVLVSGGAALGARTTYYLNRDLVRLVLLAFFVLLAFYYFGFRSKRAVLLASLVTLLGAIWSVGLMGILGYDFTLISIAAPPLILIFGNEYGIYFLNEYFRIGGRRDAPRDWIEISSRNVARPILMAFLTTATGFLSLCVTNIRQTREFAVVAGFGSFACGCLSLFLLPALLSLFGKPDEDRTRKVIDGPLSRLMVGAAGLVNRHSKPIIVSLLVAVVLFAVSVGRLTFNTDAASYYPHDDPALRDMTSIVSEIGGFDVLKVSFDAPVGRKFYFLDPEVLKKIAVVEREIEKNPDVCYAISVPKLLEDVNLAVSGKSEIPENRAMVMTLSRVVSIAGGQLFGTMANADYTRLTLSFRIYNSSNSHFIDENRFRSVLASFNATLRANPVGDAKPVVWGELMRNLDLADSLRRDLSVSMMISLLVILLIATLNFRSLKLGAFSVAPLALGLMLDFAFMALAGIPLDMTTIMVANITIGVGIDSSIYLVIQYRREIDRSSGDAEAAVTNTLIAMGRAVVLSTASIVAGLLVFTTAAFRPVMYFGLLVLFSLAVASIGTILLLPAILKVDDDASRRRRERKIR